MLILGIMCDHIYVANTVTKTIDILFMDTLCISTLLGIVLSWNNKYMRRLLCLGSGGSVHQVKNTKW